MEIYRYPIVLINYLNNLSNLRNLWIKSLFGCGFAAPGIPAVKISFGLSLAMLKHFDIGRNVFIFIGFEPDRKTGFESIDIF